MCFGSEFRGFSQVFFFFLSSEIQSEQLAVKLDQIERGIESSPIQKVEESNSNNNSNVVDEDLALALQLQQELDEEARMMEHNLRRPNTKVILDSSIVHNKRVEDLYFDNDDYDDDDDDEEEDDLYEEDYFSDEELEPDGESGVVVASESPARVTKGEFFAQTHAVEVVWKTKHDAEICGQRNADYLEETHPQHSLGDFENQSVKLSNPVFNSMMLHAERSESRFIRKNFGKSEKATREQVLDPKTRMLLFKMLNSGVLAEVNGSISTGKESVVYHAVAGDAEGSVPGTEYAVKIFKTTLNEFKARAKYVEGEHRFRHRQNQTNPRRIIRLWAEKELRNLKRAEKAGILCPRVVALKRHVLVLSFLGADGHPAPKLLDADFSKPETLQSAYMQCCQMMRKLYQECRLVHADLSEYNMLFWQKKVYFIDFAQAVEHDHPNSLRFLRDDCNHVTTFFRNKGLKNTLSVRRLFEYVSEPADKDLGVEMERKVEEDTKSDDVWFNAFLPQALSDLTDPEASFECKDKFHNNLVQKDDNDDDDDNGLSIVDNHAVQERKDRVPSPTKEQRKASKKAAKVARREQRANKK